LKEERKGSLFPRKRRRKQLVNVVLEGKELPDRGRGKKSSFFLKEEGKRGLTTLCWGK